MTTNEPFAYDKNPPVIRNNPLIFFICFVALGLAVALSEEMPQLILAALAAFILIWLYLFVRSKLRRLTITHNEIRYEEGLLNKKRTELSLASVRTIKVDQTFIQRILGIATITIFSAGDTPEISVEGLPDPHKIRELIDG